MQEERHRSVNARFRRQKQKVPCCERSANGPPPPKKLKVKLACTKVLLYSLLLLVPISGAFLTDLDMTHRETLTRCPIHKSVTITDSTQLRCTMLSSDELKPATATPGKFLVQSYTPPVPGPCSSSFLKYTRVEFCTPQVNFFCFLLPTFSTYSSEVPHSRPKMMWEMVLILLLWMSALRGTSAGGWNSSLSIKYT